MSAVDDDLPMSHAEMAGAWCVRLASQPSTDEDRAAFEAWLKEEPGNPQAYDKALSVWHGLQAIGDTPEMIGHRADALGALRHANKRRWMRRSGARWGRVAALAACLAVLISVGLYLWQPGQAPSAGGTQPAAFATTVGERRTAVLEDGSRLSLDARTQMEVDYHERRRALALVSGRAKFDVAHDPSRPFTVFAGGRTIIATGTAFSVEVLEGSLRVIVYEGHVAVLPGRPDDARVMRVARDHGGPDAASLSPGRELVVDLARPAQQIVRADVARSLAWEGGQLDFVDEPLSSAVERLNRYGRARIVIADPSAAAIEINGVFNAGDAEAFLEAIAQAYPVRVDRDGDLRTIRATR